MSIWAESWDFRPFKPSLHSVTCLSFADPHSATPLFSRLSLRCKARCDIIFSSSAHTWPPYPSQRCATLPLPRPNTTWEGHFLLLNSCASPLSTCCTSLLHVTLPITLCLSLVCDCVKQSKTYFFKIINWTCGLVHLSANLVDQNEPKKKSIYFIEQIYPIHLKHEFHRWGLK